MNALFEVLEFVEYPLYERIIEDIIAHKYAVVEDFFTAKEIAILRQSLIDKHEEDLFEKAAIGE